MEVAEKKFNLYKKKEAEEDTGFDKVALQAIESVKKNSPPLPSEAKFITQNVCFELTKTTRVI